ncbi:hypothetical protein [Cyanobium gracile]|uniref:Uncharacterized protein n=1 Tax=Cyanobium gracile (strain ATCC 27147 / PCC 6307) TaxID=292564 RepID=K9PAD1_CYAGP|nr:hypothetical protein [Cyanobium gracile]AFY30317.1 hypothetical protein Cyagr_3241 [Cyanobium gracile PCC 6307]
MASSHGSRCRSLLPVLLGLTLLGGGCQVGGVSEAGRERCRRLSAAAGNPLSAALIYVRCLPDTDRSLAKERAVMEKAAASRRAALEACRRRQRTITTLMESLRRTEEELAAAHNSPFRPSVAPPQPLDAGRESRYRPEDQRLDRERYEEALGAWEQQVAAERARWRQRREARIDAAQDRLNREARALRDLQPDLFTGPASIEFDPVAVGRVTAGCGG